MDIYSEALFYIQNARKQVVLSQIKCIQHAAFTDILKVRKKVRVREKHSNINLMLSHPSVQLNKNQPVTVHDVLQILRLHVSVPQCDVFGYLSIDHELVVLIAPVDQQPTPLQVKHTHTHTLPRSETQIDAQMYSSSSTVVYLLAVQIQSFSHFLQVHICFCLLFTLLNVF